MVGAHRLKAMLPMFALSLCVLLSTSCADDDAEPDSSALDAQRLSISGPTSAAPETTATYTIAGFEGSVTWDIESGPATVAGSGLEAVVTFSAVGDVMIHASGGGIDGYFAVSVSFDGLSYEVSYTTSQTGRVNSGGSDDIVFTFNKPLSATPSLRINGTNAGDTSTFVLVDGMGQAPFQSAGESLTALAAVGGSDRIFSASYTGGTTSGQIELILSGVVATAEYGGDEIELDVFQSFVVENVKPIVLSSWTNPSVAKDGTEVTVSFKFNEGVRPSGAAITADISGGGVTAANDVALTQAEGDPTTWWLTFTTDGMGDGVASIDLDEASFVDLAGNAMTAIAAPNASLTTDNTAPVAAGTAADLGDGIVSIATSGVWLFLEDGSDAPTTYDDFADGGSGNANFVSAAGIYDVYFAEMDEAGNLNLDGNGNLIIASQLDFVVN